MEWGDFVADVVTKAAAMAGVAGVLVAVSTYVSSSRTRRAEWLATLHEKFFEAGRYVTVRRVLGYRSEPAYGELKNAVVGEAPHELADELYRYLNFFELLGSLRGLRQISHDEILAPFAYDLRMLRDHQFILDALRSQSFEHLAAMLQDLRERLASA